MAGEAANAGSEETGLAFIGVRVAGIGMWVATECSRVLDFAAGRVDTDRGGAKFTEIFSPQRQE